MSFSSLFKLIFLQIIIFLYFSHGNKVKVDKFCGHGWTAFSEEKCYKAFSPTLNFVDAQLYCNRRSAAVPAHLATVTSKKEQDFLLNFLSSQEQFKEGSFWLGVERRGNETDFRWLSTEKKLSDQFTNWAPGRPNPPTNSVDCLMMATNSFTDEWTDEPCTSRAQFLCERPSQIMLAKMQQVCTLGYNATVFAYGQTDSGKTY